MPAFNIPCDHKYLVIEGITKWQKVNSFKQASQIAIKWGDNTNIYENLNNHDWFILAESIRGNIVSAILGDLPND